MPTSFLATLLIAPLAQAAPYYSASVKRQLAKIAGVPAGQQVTFRSVLDAKVTFVESKKIHSYRSGTFSTGSIKHAPFTMTMYRSGRVKVNVTPTP